MLIGVEGCTDGGEEGGGFFFGGFLLHGGEVHRAGAFGFWHFDCRVLVDWVFMVRKGAVHGWEESLQCVYGIARRWEIFCGEYAKSWHAAQTPS